MVVGIGGSYLGARAVIELLGRGKDSPEIYFAGNGLSTDALLETIEKVRDVDFSVQRHLQVGHHHRTCGGLSHL